MSKARRFVWGPYHSLAQRFAAKLRRVRERRALPQEALGALVGLHRTEVSLLERAQREPRLGTLTRLAEGLGVTVVDLVDGLPDLDDLILPPRA